MDRSTSKYFDNVVKIACKVFEQLDYDLDETPNRYILNIKCRYGPYTVFISELFSDKIRKYSYYVLHDNWIEAGFDNAPDPKAIRIKYGRIGRKHAGKNIPHLHLENKTKIELTAEMSFLDFVEWIQNNLSKIVGE